MSDTEVDTNTRQHSHRTVDRRRPPPLISRDSSPFAQPAVFPMQTTAQQLPPGYTVVVPQGGPQFFQGADGTLYAIHPPSAIQGVVQRTKSPLEDHAVQNSRTSSESPVDVITSSKHSSHVPLVPIYAPIQVDPSVSKKYQQLFQLPSTSRTERVTHSPLESPRQTSPIEFDTSTTQVRYVSTSALHGGSLQKSPIVVSPHSALTNCHVQSPTVNSFMDGLSTVQRASILQQHRRSLHIHEKETQEYVIEKESSGTSTSRNDLSRYTNLIQKDTKTESSSLKKLLQMEPKSDTSSTASHRTREESCDDSMLTLLQNEPYLVRFYQFFQSSEQSKHLRMRVLTTEGSASILKWIEVTRKASHIDPNFGPLDAVRILISSNGLCKLQVLFPYCKTLFTRFMPSSLVQANELFNELSPRHVLCPGIPDCEGKINALGYHPGSIRMIETPSVRRFDHEKCPLWHIPLPCNLYSESGQIMHHMCRQCKNLHNTLTRTVAKMSQFATAELLSAGSSFGAHGSTREGRLKPGKEKRQRRMASHGSLTAADICDSADTQQEEEVNDSRQNVIKYYSDTELSEDSETTTKRHEERRNSSAKSSVLVISESSSSSSMRLTTSEMMTAAPPHLLTDHDVHTQTVKGHHEKQAKSRAGDHSNDEEMLVEEPKDKMSAEIRQELKSHQKRKQTVAADSTALSGSVKKRKKHSESELHSEPSDCECF